MKGHPERSGVAFEVGASRGVVIVREGSAKHGGNGSGAIVVARQWVGGVAAWNDKVVNGVGVGVESTGGGRVVESCRKVAKRVVLVEVGDW